MDHEMHHTDEHHHAEPQPVGLPEGAALSLTGVAVEKVKEVIAREGLPQGGLRIAVTGGGCSGFQYQLSLESSARDDDTVIEQDGVKLFVDPMSQQYVYGTVLDYVSGLHGAGFKFVNPNATRTCGCGSSFSA
ncbi:MAG: iron-sulfur cluster insertion protein ErpA [Candidatus Binatia bacterium]